MRGPPVLCCCAGLFKGPRSSTQYHSSFIVFYSSGQNYVLLQKNTFESMNASWLLCCIVIGWKNQTVQTLKYPCDKMSLSRKVLVPKVHVPNSLIAKTYLETTLYIPKFPGHEMSLAVMACGEVSRSQQYNETKVDGLVFRQLERTCYYRCGYKRDVEELLASKNECFLNPKLFYE